MHDSPIIIYFPVIQIFRSMLVFQQDPLTEGRVYEIRMLAAKFPEKLNSFIKECNIFSRKSIKTFFSPHVGERIYSQVFHLNSSWVLVPLIWKWFQFCSFFVFRNSVLCVERLILGDYFKVIFKNMQKQTWALPHPHLEPMNICSDALLKNKQRLITCGTFTSKGWCHS